MKALFLTSMLIAPLLSNGQGTYYIDAYDTSICQVYPEHSHMTFLKHPPKLKGQYYILISMQSFHEVVLKFKIDAQGRVYDQWERAWEGNKAVYKKVEDVK